MRHSGVNLWTCCLFLCLHLCWPWLHIHTGMSADSLSAWVNRLPDLLTVCSDWLFSSSLRSSSSLFSIGSDHSAGLWGWTLRRLAELMFLFVLREIKHADFHVCGRDLTRFSMLGHVHGAQVQKGCLLMCDRPLSQIHTGERGMT